MRAAVLATILLVLTACCAPPPPADLVFFTARTGITVTDGAGTVISTDATVAAADWRRLYAVRGTELITLDPASNRELASTTVPRGRAARVVSTSGALVALTEPDRPRERTRLTVADPTGVTPVRDLDLPGNLVPEAFSTDDAYLFALEYLPPTAPERYRVRRVELATGAVEPLLLRDKTLIPPGAEEEMRGEGRQAVLASDRSRLYTLYLHQPDHQHTRDLLPSAHEAEGPAVHAFVHVLSLAEGWAYCLDLPTPFGEHPADTHALTLSPDGARLYIAEMTTKTITTADTASLTITKTTTLADSRPPGAGATMTTAPNGALYIGAGNILRRVDATTLRVNNSWPTPGSIHGLAVSPDGHQILVGQPDRIARMDPATGEVLDTFPAADLRTIHTTRTR